MTLNKFNNILHYFIQIYHFFGKNLDKVNTILHTFQQI